MSLDHHTTARMAAERVRDFERRADHRVDGDPREHARLVARLRERMPFVAPRSRRAAARPV